MLDNLHEVLREALRSRGWSVARFSDEVGVSPQLAYKWLAEDERWRVTPSPASCRKIAAALALDPDYVLGLAGHRDTPPTEQEERDPTFEAFVRLITPGWRAMTPSEREVAKRGALALFSVSEERVRGAGSARVRTPRQLAARMPTTSSDGTGQSHNVPIERSNRAIHDLLSHLVTLRGVTPWAAAAV